jgi:putative heme iron utilization protein
MKDMKAHLERLRDQAAECAILSAEAETKEKRELFARLTAHLTEAADHLESVINATVRPDMQMERSQVRR